MALRRQPEDHRKMGALRRVLTTAVCAATVALTGCTNLARDEPAPTAAPPTQRAPDPATTVLSPADAEKLQAVLDQVVSRYAAIPDAEVAARGVTAAITRPAARGP